MVPGLYQIQAIGARVTVLLDSNGVVLVDTGWRGSVGLISARIKELGHSLREVRLVVLSHCHPDHAGSIGAVAAATGAKVAVHRDEAGTLAIERKSLPSPFHNRLLAWVTRPLLPSFYGPPVPVTYFLQDGDRLPTTEEVRVVHTPGHTPGSICLFMPSKKVLFTGDALQYRFHRLSPAAFWVTHDYRQAVDSLRRLLTLDFDIICFSHFSPLRHDARGTLARLVDRIEKDRAHRG